MKEKQIQISQTLFIMLVRYFVLDMEVDCEEIKKELNKKLDAASMRHLYSTYKTAPTEAEKEEARQKYLDAKGVPTNFRW